MMTRRSYARPLTAFSKRCGPMARSTRSNESTLTRWRSSRPHPRNYSTTQSRPARCFRGAVFALDFCNSRARYWPRIFAGIAQLVEQLICNQQVVGSNPTAGSCHVALPARADFRMFRILSGDHGDGGTKSATGELSCQKRRTHE
jgi:hypothetical protein